MCVVCRMAHLVTYYQAKLVHFHSENQKHEMFGEVDDKKKVLRMPFKSTRSNGVSWTSEISKLSSLAYRRADPRHDNNQCWMVPESQSVAQPNGVPKFKRVRLLAFLENPTDANWQGTYSYHF